MTREISAGGIVAREVSGEWQVALIEPQREENNRVKKKSRAVLALPKGLVDEGEKPAVYHGRNQ